jgi:hypothetical protein
MSSAGLPIRSPVTSLGECLLSKFGRIIGLMIALAMFFFSVFFYVKTSDWVAGVFALGSLAYFLFFYFVYRGKTH